MALSNLHARSPRLSGPRSWAYAGDFALAFGGMVALASAMGIGRFVYTPILPAMAASLGLSKTQAGLIAAANFLGYLAGAVMAAASRLPGGPRRWFVGGQVLSAAATAGMAAVSSMPMFLLLRVLGGGASAFVLVFGSSLVLDRLAVSGRGRLAAMHFAGVGLGIAVSAVLVTGLEAYDLDWRSLWLASGVLAGVAVPVSAALVPAYEAAPTQPDAPPVACRLPGERLPRGLGALSLCHGLFGFGYVITATFLVAIVRSTPDAGALEPVVWLAVGLAAIPSTAIWGRGGARWGILPAYAIACLTEAAGVLAGGLWVTPAGTLFAAVLLGGTFMGITALGFVGARALAPKQQRRSFALMTAGFGVGQIVGPIAAGWLLDRTGSFAEPSMLAAAALVVGSGIALWTAGRITTSEVTSVTKAAEDGVSESAVP